MSSSEFQQCGFVTGHENLIVPDSAASLSKCEKDVLKYWDEINAFETTLKQSEGKKPYIFYDGPPFATGVPHYGHILASTIKDIVTRYFHMTGEYHIARKGGFDCHGLPVEYEIDKKLNITHKSQVLEMGIDKYNEECRSIVLRYTNEWKSSLSRLGRWIDLDKPYLTMDLNFMESVWWVFKQLWEKGLVYRGFKVMPYSTACTTSLSNFEANLNYKTVKDPSAIVTFPVIDDADKAALVAWTTTPWTLPCNLALCVHPTMKYVRVRDLKTSAVYIMAKPRMEALFTLPGKPKVHNAHIEENKLELQRLTAEWLLNLPTKTDTYEILSEFEGKELVGLKYTPLFPFFEDKFKETAFRVVSDTYVTADSGTGIVHSAPAFGEDDYRVCIQNQIILKGGELLCPVDDSGCYTNEVTDFPGLYVKDADKPVLAKLKEKGRLLVNQQYEHSYPFCWRSDTPLIYKAVPSWFVAVEKIKSDLVANNEQTYWVPNTIKEGRFANWLKDARDWAISRSRYWGTPIPIWISEDGTQIKVIGSVKELEEATGTSGTTDIHKHFIDHLTIPDPRGAEFPPMKRIEDVFDCWFESGSMPYAQLHYPFENQELFENGFPAQFIAEGLDQTRGWFYTLMVISTALYNKPAFQNLIVNGMVLAADGKKMSKRLKNYPDPMVVIEKYGADALRLYLINSPVVRAEPLSFKEDGVVNIIKKVMLPWWNAYRFCVENIIRYEEDTKKKFICDLSIQTKVTNSMDKWVFASLQSLISSVRVEMEAYRLYTVVPILLKFIDQLTNLYVRVNRRRLKGNNTTEEDRFYSICTLTNVLYSLCRLMGALTPFITETMYQQLRLVLPQSERVDSVHYLTIPTVDESVMNSDVERAVNSLQHIVELGRTARSNRNVSMRVPLQSMIICSTVQQELDDIKGLEDYLKEELNVRDVVYEANPDNYVKTVVTANAKVMAKSLGKKFPVVKAALSALNNTQIAEFKAAGKIVVEGETVDFENVTLTVEPAQDKLDTKKFELLFEGTLVCIMNVESNEDLVLEALAREVVNRIQRLRKQSGLTPQDKINFYYSITNSVDEEGVVSLKTVVTKYNPFIVNIIDSAFINAEEAVDVHFVAKEEFEINGENISISFSRV